MAEPTEPDSPQVARGRRSVTGGWLILLVLAFFAAAALLRALG